MRIQNGLITHCTVCMLNRNTLANWKLPEAMKKDFIQELLIHLPFFRPAIGIRAAPNFLNMCGMRNHFLRTAISILLTHVMWPNLFLNFTNPTYPVNDTLRMPEIYPSNNFSQKLPHA